MKETALLFGAVLIALGLYAYKFPVQVVAADSNSATSSSSDEDSGENSGESGAAGESGAETEKTGDAPDSQTEETDKITYKKGKTSPTALIPAGFGGLFVILGCIGFLGETPRKHAMHAAATVGSLGALAGLGRGLSKFGALMGDDPTAKRATMITLFMGILCLVYVVLSVRYFIAARKTREAAEATGLLGN